MSLVRNTNPRTLACLGGLVALAAFIQAPAPAAQTLFSGSADTNTLRIINPNDASTVSSRSISFDPNTTDVFVAFRGLAARSDGTLFALVYRGDVGVRDLAFLDPNDPNGIAHKVGTVTGDAGTVFAALAFDCNDVLYASTDQPEPGRAVRGARALTEKLYKVNTANAATTFVMNLTSPDIGEALANYTAPLLYRASGGVPPQVFQSIDVGVPSSSDIGFSTDISQAMAMTFWRAQDLFLLTNPDSGDPNIPNLLRVTRSGTVTNVGYLGHNSKGLAFVGQQCGADPTRTPTVTPTGPTRTPTRTFTPTRTPTTPPMSPTRTPTVTQTFVPDGPYCSAPGLNIPDNDPNGLSVVIPIPSSRTIQDLNVLLIIDHSRVGDLRARLSHSATTVTLFDRPGVPATQFGCTGQNVVATFDDDATAPAETSCDPNSGLSGAIKPDQPLAAFNGQNIQGNWTLNVADLEAATGAVGSLTQWCLQANFAPTPTPPGPTPSRTPTRTPTRGSPTVTPTPMNCVEQVVHGSFEPPDGWDACSTNFGSPISDLDTLKAAGIDPNSPNTHVRWNNDSAQHWLWFGGFVASGVRLVGGRVSQVRGTCPAPTPGTEAAFAEQSVVLSDHLGILRFWVWLGDKSGNSNDYMRVLIDNNEVYRIRGSDPTTTFYRQVVIDVGQFANNAQHMLRFEGFFTGRASSPSGPPALTNISVDDIGLCSAPAHTPTRTPTRTGTPIRLSAPSGTAPLTLATLLLLGGLALTSRWIREFRRKD
jgi:proprotein convertase P-domain-containing protein